VTYPLTEHERERVDECIVDFFSKIPKSERDLIAAGARQSVRPGPAGPDAPRPD
jgi:hypothetical protein